MSANTLPRLYRIVRKFTRIHTNQQKSYLHSYYIILIVQILTKTMRHARIKEIELCFAKYRNVCFFFTHGILVDAEITKDFTQHSQK